MTMRYINLRFTYLLTYLCEALIPTRENESMNLILSQTTN